MVSYNHRDIDLQILDALQEGRLTPWYISDKTGESQNYIRQRVRVLDGDVLIRRAPAGDGMKGSGNGLYELTDDGRELLNNEEGVPQ